MVFLSKNFNKVLKRFNRNNNGGARNRDSSDGSTSVPSPRRYIASNTGNFNACSRNRFGTVNNVDYNGKSKENPMP